IVKAIDQKQISDDHAGIDEVKGDPGPFVIVYLNVGGATDYKISQSDHSHGRPSPEDRIGMDRPQPAKGQPFYMIHIRPDKFHPHILPNKRPENQPKCGYYNVGQNHTDKLVICFDLYV